MGGEGQVLIIMRGVPLYGHMLIRVVGDMKIEEIVR